MSVLVFVLAWVLVALTILLIGMSGGPGGALARLQTQTRRGRRFAMATFAAAVVLLGVGVPAAVIAAVDDRNDIPQAGVSNLTASEKHGRELFGQRCGQCHTLQAANAVGTVGPNLDQRVGGINSFNARKTFVLQTIHTGRAQGNGNMPADIYTGQDAQDVANFVAKAAGGGS